MIDMDELRERFAARTVLPADQREEMLAELEAAAANATASISERRHQIDEYERELQMARGSLQSDLDERRELRQMLGTVLAEVTP